MIRKPFNKKLDSIIYKDSKYDPYTLDKTIEKINSGDWGDVSPQDKNELEFEKKYLNELKHKKGYSLDKPINFSSVNFSDDINKPLHAKIKDYWSNKSFLYKFFLIDIIIGAVSHLFIFIYVD